MNDFNLLQVLTYSNLYLEEIGNMFQDIKSQEKDAVDLYLSVYLTLNDFRLSKLPAILTRSQPVHVDMFVELEQFLRSQIEEVVKGASGQDQGELDYEKMFNTLYFAQELNVIWNLYLKMDLSKEDNKCHLITANSVLQGNNKELINNRLNNNEVHRANISHNYRLKKLLVHLYRNTQMLPKLKKKEYESIKCSFDSKAISTKDVVENSKYLDSLLDQEKEDITHIKTNFSTILKKIKKSQYEREKVIFV